MHFNLVTIFPDFFATPLETALLGKARQKGLISFSFYNPRLFSQAKHHNVDDAPYGGGPGMIMQVQPLADALKSIPQPGRILLMSPAGRPLDGKLAEELAHQQNITIICGRYEGLDARLQELFALEEISLGSAILNGGETAALAVIEAVSRFIPGFMGSEASAREESLSNGLLEYPQFTRPSVYENLEVPDVLLNGNHKAIASWRRHAALRKTLDMRPRLLDEASLNNEEAQYLAQLPRLRIGRNLSFCLCHYPVKLENHKIGVSSLTNLDCHDIARISHTYGMGPFFVYTPLSDQLELLQKIVSVWTCGKSGQLHADRAKALEKIIAVGSYDELERQAQRVYGLRPVYIVSSAAMPEKRTIRPLTFAQVAQICHKQPVIICLGTARGLAAKALPFSFEHLRPARFLDDNHLSVRAAAAIIADRILGDYN